MTRNKICIKLTSLLRNSILRNKNSANLSNYSIFAPPRGRSKLSFFPHILEIFSISRLRVSNKLGYNEKFYSSDSSFNIPLTPAIEETIEKHMQSVQRRHKELCDSSLRDEVNSSPDLISRINKDLASLEFPMFTIGSLQKKSKEISELKEIIKEASQDPEMVKMATDELASAIDEKERLQREIIQMIIPMDEAENRGCILEVRAGTGGDEASLFAMDIFKMYERYSAAKKWKFECDSLSESVLGGYKEATVTISGAGAYGRLQFESGVHRVQRVPVTERSGRVHTSASSVVVLPLAEEVDVVIRNEDLRIDTFRSGGAGGQSVNTTCSAVRVTHVPTGVTVAIQDERSQHQNKAKALRIVRAKLFDIERRRREASISHKRNQQIGSGDRSERVRTYNFPQGRVTDHRVNVTLHSLSQVLEGEGLDDFIDALRSAREKELLESVINGS